MRFLTSWPLATLLLGIAALMGLNAATSDGKPSDPTPAEGYADSTSVPQPFNSQPLNPQPNSPQPNSPQPLNSQPNSPVPFGNTLIGEATVAQMPVAGTANDSIGWQAAETLAAPVGQVAQLPVHAPREPMAALPVANEVPAPAQWRPITPADTAANPPTGAIACTLRPDSTPANPCAAVNCPGEACPQQTCPQRSVPLATATITSQHIPFVHIAQALSNPPYVQPSMPSEQEDPFAVFGPQAALVRHLVDLHEQLGEMRGEASLRESVISTAVENAKLTANLEAHESHQELLDELVGATIELTRLETLRDSAGEDAGVAWDSGEEDSTAKFSNIAEQLGTADPEVASTIRSNDWSSETGAESIADASAQQAKIDDLRRENAELRAQIEAIRAQLNSIAKPAAEPSVAKQPAKPVVR